MEFNLKVAVDLHEIMENATDPIIKAQLFNLWKNLCHHERATEAISVGRLHSEEVLEKSRKEISRLSSAKNLHKSIICD